MSHPVPGHDYSERHNEESHKEYEARKKAGESVGKKKKEVANKMLGFHGRNSRPMLSYEEHKKHMENFGKDYSKSRPKDLQEYEKKVRSLHIMPHTKR